ncbi:MAG: aromatic ring-hydroxylating dioxygenase subunit alpha, partial [Chloroflexota bacterium]
MLSKTQNERLTQVGPGTPMGNLLRRYWHPIAVVSELGANPVKKVRLLCEDLVLYQDRSGTLGLIDEPCPHRRVSMEYGIPEAEGLRCPYHGWLFNHDGRCTEQPAEPWNSTFKDRVTTKAYPVQELGGLVFAYLGPQPVPLLPRYDVYVWDDVVRHVGVTILPCSWLQAMENSLDPVHAEWLHGYYMDYVNRRKGGEVPPNRLTRKHKKIGFDRFEHGIVKRRVLEGETEEGSQWTVGHPIIFPYMLRIGAASDYSFQIRVPIDDTHTWHAHYLVYRPGIPVPPQQAVPVYDIPLRDGNDKFITDFVIGQDHFAWVSQGPIAARDKEHLGQSDVGVIMYRELLLEQIDQVEQGL